MSLANRVRELRQARNWTVTDVARFVQCTPSNITHIEMGRITNPTKRTLSSLARMFCVPVDYLTGGEND